MWVVAARSVILLMLIRVLPGAAAAEMLHVRAGRCPLRPRRSPRYHRSSAAGGDIRIARQTRRVVSDPASGWPRRVDS